MNRYLKLVFIGLLCLSSCNTFRPQKKFRIAVPKGDYSYTTSSSHLQSFLENGGFNVQIIETDNAIAANQMVVNDEADLTFVMNNSDFIPEKLSGNVGGLRTISLLYERLFFIFSRTRYDSSLSRGYDLQGKKIGIEVLNGETHQNLRRIIDLAHIDRVDVVKKSDNPDYIHFWGTYYGDRATKLIADGWQEISLEPSMVNFLTLNQPTLKPFLLPAIPGFEGSNDINTFSVSTYLVGSSRLGEKAIYHLSQYIIEHRLELMGYDLMYRSVNETIDASSLLFPLHRGTDAYFRKDQPSFLERYADTLAFLVSIAAVLYGLIQGLRNRLRVIKKERIDLYFLDFLDIRSKQASSNEQIVLLEELLNRALLQMTNERLDKNDFDIFSRLIQQEISNIQT
ncbi:MAG: hypothetical protein GY816_24225 [Cytophagales bacterium]|nr:hypothetical protein [Cytophagales bacterium]